MRSYELPEAGYEEFGTADDDRDWFDCFDVWLKDGVFYWASDSGCSCYSAFEDADFPEDFEGHGNAHDALKALHDWSGGPKVNHGTADLVRKLLDYKPPRPSDR